MHSIQLPAEEPLKLSKNNSYNRNVEYFHARPEDSQDTWSLEYSENPEKGIQLPILMRTTVSHDPGILPLHFCSPQACFWKSTWEQMTIHHSSNNMGLLWPSRLSTTLGTRSAIGSLCDPEQATPPL
ncbi:hypothetical protein KIL84_014395 [Mauremys mutica]|uniref:Uncharacterized protein n=1 Tax=Mauremys mutica TaxID=74926 RepID=A0A9D4B898_9SAUR|nr:hypothetical protein KIL84_014395 [Mauremys mutica]